jgi:Ca-activated chloride channel homolog
MDNRKMNMGETYYDLLNISKDATLDEIRFSYFEQARKYHPDTNQGELARELFFQIQKAYEVLRDPKKRKIYDLTLVNTDDTQKLIDVSIAYSNAGIPRLNELQLFYAKIEINCKEKHHENNLPQAHICLIIDRSTSMKGNRIEMVKENVNRFLHKLNPSDLVSIITFNDKAELLMAPTKVSDIKQIEKKIDQIICSGATEIFKGIKAGSDVLWGNTSGCFSKHMVLLTDGHTYGDEEACFGLMQKLAEKGIVVSALGIGHEWNDAFLDRLANMTGGSSSFVSTPEDLNDFMRKFAESINTVYARGLSLDFESDEIVKTKYIFRIQPEIAELPLEKPIPLGDLYQNRKSIYLIAFLISPLPREKSILKLGKGKIRLEINSTEIIKSRIIIDLQIPVIDELRKEQVPVDIVNALSRINIYQMQLKANQDVQNGNIQRAINRLGDISTQLLAQGNKEMAKIVLTEAEMLKKNQRYSADGDKQLKYGTRALLLPPENEKRDP